jgi:hypothetical protein
MKFSKSILKKRATPPALPNSDTKVEIFGVWELFDNKKFVHFVTSNC